MIVLLSTVDSWLGWRTRTNGRACRPRCALVSVRRVTDFVLAVSHRSRYDIPSVSLAPANASSMNYDTHTYLAVLLTHSSSLLADPSRVHPQLKHVGPVRYDILPNLIRSGPHAMPKGRGTA